MGVAGAQRKRRMLQQAVIEADEEGAESWRSVSSAGEGGREEKEHRFACATGVCDLGRIRAKTRRRAMTPASLPCVEFPARRCELPPPFHTARCVIVPPFHTARCVLPPPFHANLDLGEAARGVPPSVARAAGARREIKPGRPQPLRERRDAARRAVRRARLAADRVAHARARRRDRRRQQQRPHGDDARQRQGPPAIGRRAEVRGDGAAHPAPRVDRPGDGGVRGGRPAEHVEGRRPRPPRAHPRRGEAARPHPRQLTLRAAERATFAAGARSTCRRRGRRRAARSCS